MWIAGELRLHGIGEDPDELIDRAETAKLAYREFLHLVLESEVGVLEGRRAQQLKLRADRAARLLALGRNARVDGDPHRPTARVSSPLPGARDQEAVDLAERRLARVLGARCAPTSAPR
jgi:hypothetical protein